MFNEEFFPTPSEVIEKMIEPFLTKSRMGNSSFKNPITVLEPSAGKGDILDYISKTGHRSVSMYCCEKNADLRFILQEKGYRVIADDFLAYNGSYLVDLIIMNPPFSNGDEHLLHAWEVLEEGDIVCLLNSATIENPFSEKRKLLAKIIKQYGSTETLGPVFSNAERETSVNVSLVRLRKTATTRNTKMT